jgi:asparagine N-glycosylation enzyme membrane subunit Stt3
VLSVSHLHGLVMLLALSLVWAATSLLRRAKRRRVSRWVILSYYVAMWAMVGWSLLTGRATP